MAERILTHANESVLANRIDQATSRICYVAPGLHEKVARALAAATGRIGKDRVRAIVDPNPEVCRLGFGALPALELLRSSECDIRSCPGLRLGLLLTDESALVFAPTPQYLEPEPRSFETPNAVVISSSEARRLLSAIYPEEDLFPEAAPEIGRVPIADSEITAAKRDLEERPPIAPDLARQMRVLSSQFQLVKVEFEGSRIEQRRLQLNAKHLGISNKKVQAHLGGTWKVFDKAKAVDLKSLKKQLEGIKSRLLIPLGRFGSAISFDKRPEFEKAIRSLSEKVDKVREKLRESLTKDLAASKERLLSLILTNLEKRPPEDLAKFLISAARKEQIRQYAERLVDRAGFPTIDDLLGGLECHYEVFNVSEHLLQDQEFKRKVEEAFGCPIEKLAVVQTAISVRPSDAPRPHE